MYFLFYIDNHHDSINFLSKFSVFNKEKIVKHFFKHEKLLLIKADSEQQKIFEYAFKILNDNAEKYPLTKRGWNREYISIVLDKIQKDGIPFKVFKHEAEVKDFANDKKSTKTKPKNATITPKKAPTIKKSSVKSVKITKKEGKTMAKRKTRKKLSGNALKQTAYSRLKSGLMKLVRRRGKNINTRYAGRVSKGVYTYKLKGRKKR